MNKYQTHFKKPYALLENVVKDVIQDGFQVLDLGSNSGTLASLIAKYHKNCFVHCVDNDGESLKRIPESLSNGLKTQSYCTDANLFLSDENIINLDAVIINAALHEINNPLEKASYLSFFFKACKRKLKKSGIIVIGDYYYSESVPDVDVNEYIAQQLREINHADSRDKSIQPDLIWQVATASELSVVKHIEIPAVQGIDRRYYISIINCSQCTT